MKLVALKKEKSDVSARETKVGDERRGEEKRGEHEV